jgi:hypothetical protein
MFRIGVVVFAYLFLSAQNVARQEQEALFDATDRVRQLVQTLPPSYFRKRLTETQSDAYHTLQDLVPRTVGNDVDDASLLELVRILLYGIATLGFIFDDHPKHSGGQPARYASNVMVFVPAAAAAPFFSTSVSKLITFEPRDVDLGRLRGVLLLRTDLSAASDAATAQPDRELQEFALPVPLDPRTQEGRWRVLPGAPKAFVTGSIDGYQKVDTLPSWMETEGGFLHETREQLREYFRSSAGQRIRSFISRPLADDGEPLDVWNIHADCEGILGPGVPILDDGSYIRAANERRDLFFQ